MAVRAVSRGPTLQPKFWTPLDPYTQPHGIRLFLVAFLLARLLGGCCCVYCKPSPDLVLAVHTLSLKAALSLSLRAEPLWLIQDPARSVAQAIARVPRCPVTAHAPQHSHAR